MGAGGHARLRVRGWGGPNSYDWRKALHSVYSVVVEPSLLTNGTAGIVFYRLRARDGYAGSDSLTRPFSAPLCYLQPHSSPLLLTNYHPLSSLDCLH
jgi:hypothetical protein